MGEINVKITEMDDAITKMQALQAKCGAADTNAPITIGGGKSVNELEAIADTYKKMNVQFGNLVSNTVQFLINVRDSYISSDQKAAQGMMGE